jgi:hypothetical protein
MQLLTYLKLSAVSLCVLLLASCGSTPKDTGSFGYSDEVYNASNRAVTLQSLKARDVDPVQESLESWLAGDIKTLHSRLQTQSLVPFDAQQRAAALRTLVLLAVLQERYPVEVWNRDPEVAQALAWAVVQDSSLTAKIRARDFDRSLLRNR